MSEGARQQQKKQTRERILDAAGRLMADGRGLDSLGLREVAREAGLAATSLYNHFPDMEALGLALIDRACFHLRSSMAEGRRSMIEVGAARAVRELVARFVRFQQDYENEFRLLVQQRLGRRSSYRRRIHGELQLMVNELAEDVREAEAAIAVMFGLGIAMLDVSPARRRELAENAGDQVEIIALGGRCWAAGDRL